MTTKGDSMIKREEALQFLNEQIENKNIISHMLATEAIMRTLAKKFEPEKEETWALAGLLHDGDYRDDVPASEQGIKISQMLEKKGFAVPEEVKHCMAAHNRENTGVEPESKMDWSLFICDSLTGLIVATALVRPDKKLASVKVKSVKKKFKDKAFARGTRREDIALCEEKLGLPLDEFVKISLEAMQKIAKQLGL
jgi:predicted hydrolase (HD superfamily)